MRRWTGLSPSRTSGSARPTMTLIAESRYAVRISSSSARGSMLPPPITSVDDTAYTSSARSASDIQVRHQAGVALDEVAARLDLVAHEHREDPVGAGSVVDAHAGEGAVAGIHGRLAQLVGVHLAEALEALQADALLRDAQHRVAQLLEGERLLHHVRERNRERRRPGQLDELVVHLHERPVLRCGEELPADPVRAGQAAPRLDGAHADVD